MNRSLPLVAVAFSALSFACSVPAPDAPELDDDGLGSAALVGAQVTELQICPKPVADVTVTLAPSTMTSRTGAADLADPCDHYVVDFTGVHGGDLAFKAGVNGFSQNQIDTEARCLASSMSATLYGQLPPRITFENGHFVVQESPWEPLFSKKEQGHWSGTNCGFPFFQQMTSIAGPTGAVKDVPYARMRVASRGVVHTAAGAVAVPLIAWVHRYDY